MHVVKGLYLCYACGKGISYDSHRFGDYSQTTTAGLLGSGTEPQVTVPEGHDAWLLDPTPSSA